MQQQINQLTQRLEGLAAMVARLDETVQSLTAAQADQSVSCQQGESNIVAQQVAVGQVATGQAQTVAQTDTTYTECNETATDTDAVVAAEQAMAAMFAG